MTLMVRPKAHFRPRPDSKVVFHSTRVALSLLVALQRTFQEPRNLTDVFDGLTLRGHKTEVEP